MFRPTEPSPRDPRRARNTRPHAAAARSVPALSTARRTRAAGFEGRAIRGAWLMAPMLLLALACTLRFAVRGADASFALCFAMLLGLGVVWFAIRLCWPGPGAASCPNCRRETLVRLVALQATGARCLHCGWLDETADARELEAPIALPAHFRTALHAARPGAQSRPDQRGGSRGLPFKDRPPRGPSDRRWRRS